MLLMKQPLDDSSGLVPSEIKHPFAKALAIIFVLLNCGLFFVYEWLVHSSREYEGRSENYAELLLVFGRPAALMLSVFLAFGYVTCLIAIEKFGVMTFLGLLIVLASVIAIWIIH